MGVLSVNGQGGSELVRTYPLEEPLILAKIRSNARSAETLARKEASFYKSWDLQTKIRYDIILATTYLQLGEYDSALARLAWLLDDQAEPEGLLYPEVMNGQIVMGYIRYYQDAFSEAYEWQKKAKTIAEHKGKRVDLAFLESLQGLTLLRMGVLEKGMEVYQQSMEGFISLGYKREALVGASNLAAMYINASKFQAAIDLISNAFPKLDSTASPMFLILIRVNRALAHLKLGEEDSALFYALPAIGMADQLNEPISKTYSRLVSSFACQESGDWTRARELAEQAGVALQKIPHNKDLASYFFQVKGAIAEHDGALDSALVYYLRAADLATPGNVFPSFNESIEGAHRISLRLNRLEVAQQAFLRMSYVKDSIFQSRKVANLDLYQAQADLREKENQLGDAQNAIQIQALSRQLLLGALVGMFLVSALLFLYFRLRNIRDRSGQIEAHNQVLASYTKELEELAFVVSHNLRESTRNIHTYTGLFVRKMGDQVPEEVKKPIQRILEASSRSLLMLQDLETYVEIGRNLPPAHPVALGPLLEELIAARRETWNDAGATISLGPMPILHGHSFLFRQLFSELIDNAFKYRSQQALRLDIRWEDSDKAHRIFLSDNGVGFNQEYAEKIFRIFQRLHDQEEIEGTGIGLAMVDKIVRLYGGTVSATSKEGKGCQFELIFPVSSGLSTFTD